MSCPNGFSLGPLAVVWIVAIGLAVLGQTGCGTTAQRGAMDQLLVSDAVDQAVARIDFSPLRGKTVYMNSDYIKNVKSLGFVNSEYVISALRHRVITSGCYLQDRREDAEVVIEPRVGTLGSDEYNITYGLPRSETASSLASLAASSPVSLPALPELALSKSEYRQGVAKIHVFAYRREDQTAVWQSGVAKSTATSRDTWILGAGPIQRGTVYDGTRFAGSKLRRYLSGTNGEDPMPIDPSYRVAKTFDPPLTPLLPDADSIGGAETRMASGPESQGPDGESTTVK